MQAAVHVELGSVKMEATRGGKPMATIEIADAGSKQKLKIWSDTQAMRMLTAVHCGNERTAPEIVAPAAVCVEALFTINEYGLAVARPEMRLLTAEEETALYAGDAAFAERNQREWEEVCETVDAMESLYLQRVGRWVLQNFEKEFRRAAAAFGMHHARRGGLLEHTAGMLRAAKALAPLYPEVTPDLLFAGVILHDVGKVVESDYAERGFVARRCMTGELSGHIVSGMLLVSEGWLAVNPCMELDLRDHLIHLIASHHGCNEWGSPVEPKTPEALLLHQIDMIDSRMEKMRAGLKTGVEIAENVFESPWPVKGRVVKPWGMVDQGGPDL